MKIQKTQKTLISNNFYIPISIILSSLILFLVLNYDILFQWFYPDDLRVITVANKLGYLGCVENYFINTTLNRLTSDTLICAFNLIEYASTPFMGLVLLRILLLLTLPISIALFFNKYILKNNNR
jgi:hypothetical protein